MAGVFLDCIPKCLRLIPRARAPIASPVHSAPRARGSKLFWLFYIVGVGCFGYVSYSTSPELTALVTFRIPPRRRVD